MKAGLRWSGIGILSLGAALLIAGLICGGVMKSNYENLYDTQLDVAFDITKDIKPEGVPEIASMISEKDSELEELGKQVEQWAKDHKDELDDFKREVEDLERTLRATTKMPQSHQELLQLTEEEANKLKQELKMLMRKWAENKSWLEVSNICKLMSDFLKFVRQALNICKESKTYKESSNQDMKNIMHKVETSADEVDKVKTLGDVFKGLVIAGPILIVIGGGLALGSCFIKDSGDEYENAVADAV